MRNPILLNWFEVLLLSAGTLVGCNQLLPGSTVIPTVPQTAISIPSVPAVRTTPSPLPTITSTATVASTTELSPTNLKYHLTDQFGTIFFCDSDAYPVAHEVSDQEIAQRVSEIRQNPEEYEAILIHLSLQSVSNLSPSQNRLIDAEHKRLNAIQLEPAAQDYTFSLRIRAEGSSGFAIEGTISSDGNITVTSKQPAMTVCPICLAGSTLIATPNGAVPVRVLRNGMLVWTATAAGEREIGVILETVQRPVPRDILIVDLGLDDGRELFASASHPTLTGKQLGDLVAGDVLDGARVIRSNRIPLDDDATYDILPSGETGAYWANGILLGSTLQMPATDNK